MPVSPSDDANILQERIKLKEHEAYPRAVDLVASGRARLGEDGRIAWAK